MGKEPHQGLISAWNPDVGAKIGYEDVLPKLTQHWFVTPKRSNASFWRGSLSPVC